MDPDRDAGSEDGRGTEMDTLTTTQRIEAIGWFQDVFYHEAPEDYSGIVDRVIIADLDRLYAGGSRQFVIDGIELEEME